MRTAHHSSRRSRSLIVLSCTALLACGGIVLVLYSRGDAAQARTGDVGVTGMAAPTASPSLDHDPRKRPEPATTPGRRGPAPQADLAERIDETRGALRVAPGDADLHAHLADLLRETAGASPAALAEYRQAVRCRPGAVSLHYRLGEALDGAGLWPEARHEWQAAMTLPAAGGNGLESAHDDYWVSLARKRLHAGPGAAVDTSRR